MELQYTFTKEEYEKTVEALLRRRRNSPLSLILLALLTVVQFGGVLAAILRYHTPPGQTALLLGLSLAICAIQIFYRYATGLRARSQTARAIQRGQIREDFWKKQRLRLQDDLLTLRCGKTELSYDCAYYSGSSQAAGTLLLVFTKGKTVHQLMVPASAFASDAQKQAFLDALQAGKLRSIQAGFAKARGPRPENADFSLTWRCSRRDFARDQVRAVRAAYTRRVGWTLPQIARLAAAGFLLYHFIRGSYQSTGMQVFIALVLLLLLYPLLISFTPLCRLIVRRNTDSLFAGLEEQACTLDLAGEKLSFSGDTFENALDLKQLYDVAELGGCVVLYWKDNTAITIPADAAALPEAQGMLAVLRPTADENWRSRQGKDLLR